MKNYTKEITFEDILESIKYLSEKERKIIRDKIGPKYYENLDEQYKFETLMEIMKKCNLETIEQIADIYDEGTFDYNKAPGPAIG